MDNKNFGLSILDTNDIMDGPWDKIYKMDKIKKKIKEKIKWIGTMG